MVDVSPNFVAQHSAFAAWLLGLCGAAAVALLGMYARKFHQSSSKAFKTLEEIKGNHLEHIEKATGETRDQAIQTNAKLDTLIAVIEKKL